MFFDLEAVLPLVHSIVSVWRVHTRLVSCFILSGVPRGGADMPVSRGSLGRVECGLISCSATPCLTCQQWYHSAVCNVFLMCGLMGWQKVCVTLHFIPVDCCSLFGRSEC